MTDLTALVEALPPELAEHLQQARNYALHSKAGATRRAYASDWRHFNTWCSDRALPALPAEPTTVALYLAALADTLKPATLARRVTTIAEAHRTAGHPTPTDHAVVRAVLQGIRKTKGVAQKGKAPILTSDLLRMLARLPDDRQGRRDRALLLVGFAGAFRRSELVALDVDDLDFRTDGLVVNLRRSKTDQEGQGAQVAIPFGHGDTCPVHALQAWLNHGQIASGPVFRAVSKADRVLDRRLTDKAVALVIKRVAAAAEIDPQQLSGHSLRAGFATQAALNGAQDRAIMKQTRHRTRAMVDRYVRDGSLFRENAATTLGL